MVVTESLDDGISIKQKQLHLHWINNGDDNDRYMTVMITWRLIFPSFTSGPPEGLQQMLSTADVKLRHDHLITIIANAYT